MMRDYTDDDVDISLSSFPIYNSELRCDFQILQAGVDFALSSWSASIYVPGSGFPPPPMVMVP